MLRVYKQAKKLDVRPQPLHTGLYETEEKSSTKFIVDTGACVSIIPAYRAQQQFCNIKTSMMLPAANGASVRCTAPSSPGKTS